MEVITYSLRADRPDSDAYYRDVAALADEVLTEAQGRLLPLVKAFGVYVRSTQGGAARTAPEYVLEILNLGVLWRIYAAAGLQLSGGPRMLLTGLVRLRERAPRLEPLIDPVRGVLATLYLLPNSHSSGRAPSPTLDRLDRLVGWLAATGHYSEAVKRLRGWQGFLAGRPPDRVAGHLAAATDFAAWFEARSEAALGRYTAQVGRFLAEGYPRHRWRYPVIFCGRRRVEYHLNMVGTEILNRAFRQAFLNTARKVVVVPPCMRVQPDHDCQSRQTGFGARCARCKPDCRVRQVTEIGEEQGFEVRIIPEQLRVFSDDGPRPMQGAGVGVVGVSCVLTNTPGGWEMKDLGVPAQGVPLDYCGCRYYWHEQGIPTAVNVGQLLRVLGRSNGWS